MPEKTIRRFAGINNKARPESLNGGWVVPDREVSPADLTVGLNVDITDEYQLRSRLGQTVQIAGTQTSLWSDGDIALFVEGGQLIRLWPDMTTTTITSGVGSEVSYVRVDDTVYWTDGMATGVIESGIPRSWGLEAPIISGVGSINSGLLQGGSYQVAITGVRPNGIESGTNNLIRVPVIDNSSVVVNWIDPMDAEIQSVNVYVSNRDGEALFLAGNAPVSDKSFTHSGGQLSSPLNLQWFAKPPAGQLLAKYKGRILIAVGEYVFVTTPQGFEHVDMRDFISVDGSRITMIEALDDAFYVGTDRGVSYFKGDKFNDMTVIRSSSTGVVKGSSVVADGFKLFGRVELAGQTVVVFTTSDGVMAGLSDGDLVNLTESTYDLTTGTSSAAIFRSTSDIHQYIVVQQ
jgi:hypothetical protein